MAGTEIRPYDSSLINPSTANWKMNGRDGDWGSIDDIRWGSINHVVVVDEGRPLFDKIDISLKPGAYVIPVRINPERKAEFFVPLEKRVLLKDPQGVQGNVWTRNIPQGVIEEGEKASDAAKRELLEETGYEADNLVFLGQIAFTPANSGSVMPFFMAVVPYENKQLDQRLEPGEEIQADKWFTLHQLRKVGIIDGSTHIGLSLATNVLRPDLL